MPQSAPHSGGSGTIGRPELPRGSRSRKSAVTRKRTGFFESEQYLSVLADLPAAIRSVITFAYLTGWRIASEVLPLQWRLCCSTRESVRW